MRRLPNILHRGFSTIDQKINQQLKLGRLEIDRSMGLGLAKQILKYADTENIPLTSITIDNIGDSVEEIADYVVPFLVKDKATIATLSLDRTKIGDGGIATISEALKDNRSLVNLSLHRNNIGFKGAKSLTDMLFQNKKIKFLSIEGNAFFNHDDLEYDDLLLNFAEALKHNNSLKSFNCSLYLTTPKREQIITEALNQNFFLAAISRNSGFVSDQAESITNQNVGKLKDMLGDFTTILIARMARKIDKSDPENYFYEMRGVASYKTREVLLKDLSNQDIAGLVDYWHLPLTQQESQKLRHYSEMEWTPLFAEKEISVPDNIINKTGWKIVERTNSKELEAEGKNLEHCVGGYTSQCFSENSHIISIVDEENKSDSTIEITLKKDILEIKQHFGSKNTAPSENSKLILEWLEQNIQSGAIAIDCDQLEKDRVARNNAQKGLKTKMGFDPCDDKEFNDFVRTFRRKILPTGEKYKIEQFTANFNNFLSDIEIDLNSVTNLDYNKRMSLRLGNNPPTANQEDLVTLKSILPKDRDQEEELRKKINFGIQGSINKVCGKEKTVTVSINDNDEVTFSSKDIAALEILKKIFGENVEQDSEGLVVRNLAALEVRKIAAQEASKVKKEKQRENRRNGDDEKNPISSDDSDIPATKVSNQSSESLSKNERSLEK